MTSSSIRVTRTETTLSVLSPYNSLFVADARKLAGRWQTPCWTFDVRNEEAIKKILRRAYGVTTINSDGSCQLDVVSVRIHYPEADSRHQGGFTAQGRTIATATGRDSGATLGEGVVLESGDFDSGGSMKNWTTCVEADTFVVLHDFPRHAAEWFVAHKDDENSLCLEILQPAQPAEGLDKASLRAERERLMERIAEIDLLLTSTQ